MRHLICCCLNCGSDCYLSILIHDLDGKREEAASFWNSLMIPIWKGLQTAQATEIKCKRPLRLKVCRLGIITLWAFEKKARQWIHLGKENPNTELFSGKQTPDRRVAKVGPGGPVVCKLNSGQPCSLAGWEGSPGWGWLCRRTQHNSSSVDSSSWAAPGTTHSVPTTSLPGKLKQFGGSAENSNKSE